jgi:cardiolipin synthase
VNLPNIITTGRILVVPIVVWAIISGQMQIAFWLFVLAAISDAVDGFLAKRLGAVSEFGAYLDPLADKTLLVSIYVTLGIANLLPRWLVIAVVSRDIMIVGAVMLSWLVGKPVRVKPLMVSKLNTAAQIVYACVVLASHGFDWKLDLLQWVLMVLVTALTLLSVAFYVAEWVRHMNSADTA